MRLRPPVLLALLLLAGSATAAADDGLLGFAAYPGARALCDEHVVGPGLEIHWRSVASVDAPERVLAFYEKRHGKAKADEYGGSELRLAGQPDAILTVIPAAKAAAYPRCDAASREGERTVILVSSALRRP